MSRENVEVVQRIAEAWNRRDLEQYLALTHPGIEWRPGATRVEGRPSEGHDGMRAFWAEIHASFDHLVVEFDDIRDAGEVAVGLGQLRGRSKSGVPIETQYGVVALFRDGLVISGSDWSSHAEALAAAGLKE